MALGLPAVASRAGGNPDVITSGETGVLVSPLDPSAWAGALERVLGDREFAQRIARAGRDRVRREFTLEPTAEPTAAVYREALERQRGWTPPPPPPSPPPPTSRRSGGRLPPCRP